MEQVTFILDFHQIHPVFGARAPLVRIDRNADERALLVDRLRNADRRNELSCQALKWLGWFAGAGSGDY
jgi:hypothetical protein